MISAVTDLQQRWQQGVTWLNHRTHGWFPLLFESLRDVLSFTDSLYAAATAYFTLLAIFPLILLTVGIASFWFDPVLTEDVIFERLEFAIPALDDLLGVKSGADRRFARDDHMGVGRFAHLVGFIYCLHVDPGHGCDLGRSYGSAGVATPCPGYRHYARHKHLAVGGLFCLDHSRPNH